MLSRRQLLGSLGALAACRRPTLAPRANVLIVTFCSLRADRVGWLGYHTRDTTPNLDQFAKGAYRFTRAWANATWTNASHASILTGLFPGHHHVLDDVDPMAEGLPTLPGILRAAGWRTAALVEEASDMSMPNACGVLRDVEQVWRLTEMGLFDPKIVADWVAADSAPYFALVHLREAHLPFGDGSPFIDPATLDPRMKAWRAGLPRPGTAVQPKWDFPEDPLSWLNRHKEVDAELKAALDVSYDSSVHAADASFGALLTALGGHLDNTIVIAVADHGELLVGHKDALEREVVRVPLLLRLPGGAEAGRDIGTDVSQVDLLPTVLEAIGLPAPHGDGASLMDELERDGPARSAFTQSAGHTPTGSVERLEAIARGPLRLQQLDPEHWRVELEKDGTVTQLQDASPEAAALHEELVRLGADSWMPAPGRVKLSPDQVKQMQKSGYF